MARDWESVFTTWGQPPSATEQEKCQNAERAVTKAIRACATLAARDITVFAQGSYANRTNVRQDSDVDICVLCKDVCFTELAEGMTLDSVGLTDASYTYSQFKNDVHAALNEYFGAPAVTRGNKAFDVHANTYRVDADVVPCFEHVRYSWTSNGSVYTDRGTELRPDNGGRIINWPRQNYENGVSKNEVTGRRFKALVRIMKRLRLEMQDRGIVSAKPIPSFLTECLVWNVPNAGFGHDAYKEDVRYAIGHLWNNTRTDEQCNEWGEINELKYLFRGQAWGRQQVNEYLQAAWDYVGFK